MLTSTVSAMMELSVIFIILYHLNTSWWLHRSFG